MAAKKLPELTALSELIARHPVKYSDSGCWLWQRHLTHNGYGVVSHQSKNQRAHRVAYMLATGQIPKGLQVCHHCDNRRCINPDHLFLGTQLSNMRDMISKGRKVVARGERHHDAKLTDAQVIDIFNDPRDRKVIAAEYDIHLMYVHSLKRGASRKYLTQKLSARTQNTD